ncbi:MAG: ADP-ribosylglycohydrolase family protein [Spirochaetes bacterium]|nr:ADP-ribosylglycohydrolase family protein [Spirochaetota bacterium]
MKQISYPEYYDKTLGCWIGKSIGGTIGAQAEGIRKIMNYTFDNAFPDELPPNDDLDLQLLWLEVMEKEGPHFTSNDLADIWLEKCWYPFNEYGIFKWNYRKGIKPPASGRYNNAFWSTGMGCPIRSEIWAAVFPGNEKLAAAYAYKDGCLDHDATSVEAEQMFSAMESAAYFEDDIFTLLTIGMKYLGRENPIRGGIDFIVDAYKKKIPWQKVWETFIIRYGNPEACDAIVNVPLTIMALLYGKGDFPETMLLALNMGYDTDCTAATAGSILGIISGAAKIPALWKDKLNDTLVIGINTKRPENTITRLAADTCVLGVAYAGTVNKAVSITKTPTTIASVDAALIGKPKNVTITVDYNVLPTIAMNGTAVVTLNIHNAAGKPVSGTLSIKTPTGFTVKHKNRVSLKNGGTVSVSVAVSHAGKTLAEKNIFIASVVSGKNKLVEKSFGIAGAARWQVYGPYWDIYDRAKQPQDPYDARNRPQRNDMSWRNYLVSLDRDFIAWNDDAAVKTAAERTKAIFGTNIIDAHEYLVPVDAFLSYQGEGCLYLVREFLSPIERKVKIRFGSSSPAAVMLNGTEIIKQQNHARWQPAQVMVDAVLQQGVNKIVIKVLKRDTVPTVSIAFHETNTSGGGPLHQEYIDDIVSVG